jgi:hypothetical protein
VARTLCELSLVATIALAGAGAAAAAVNPIRAENALPGTTAWELPGATPTSIPISSAAIEGYASESSVQPGDFLHMHVSTTPAASYRIEVYRLGWYQGLGGRLIACLPACGGSESGAQQPVGAPDPTTGYLDAGWPVTDTITVPGWTSGYFVAKLILTSGPSKGGASYIAFIVRAAPGAGSAILVQSSVNTWQAYNRWGGKSLYSFNSTSSIVPSSKSNAASQVSFNRPGLGQGQGPFEWEDNLVRFLERGGYDVSYQADTDTDQNPASLLSHRLDVAAGHDEYWTKSMRDAWESARNQGVNLAFLGGNIGYWQARFADATDRTLIEYRSATLDPDPDPTQKTVGFDNLNPARPECQLLGIGYQEGLARTGDPIRSYAITTSAAGNSWFAGTGLTPGATILDSVGYEWDTLQPGCAVPPTQVLFHWAGSPTNADAVTYRAKSGARVFSDGSMQVVWALDDFGHTPHADGRVQRLYINIFNDLGSTVALVDTTPPAPFRLRSPTAGAVLWTVRPQLRWTASSDPGSGLAPYIVSVDGRKVTTTTRTSYTAARELADGRHTWTVVAVDRAGNRRSVSSSFRVETVRVVKRSRAHVLRHGFSLLVSCPHRCSARISIRFGRKGPVLTTMRRSLGPGIASVSIPLTATFRTRLTHARTAKLLLSARTRSGHSLRSVTLTAQW